MYKNITTKMYNKSLVLAIKRGYKISDIDAVVELLQKSNEPLPQKYKDHKLSGEFIDCRECHISPDRLLIYKKQEKN